MQKKIKFFKSKSEDCQTDKQNKKIHAEDKQKREQTKQKLDINCLYKKSYRVITYEKITNFYC